MYLNLLLALDFIIYSFVNANSEWDCVVSEWSAWGACNEKCTTGLRTRTRTVVKPSTHIFSKPCPHLSESQNCGQMNNGCEKVCEKMTGKCLCLQGYMLNMDRKTCMDVNECMPNNNKGPCSYGCKNLAGGYQCFCPVNHELEKDGHRCKKIVSPASCADDGIHVYDSSRNCVCANKLSGLHCDRLAEACNNLCQTETLCVRLVIAQKRCIEKHLQVPVLLPVSHKKYLLGLTQYNVEIYISRLLRGVRKGITLKDISFSSHEHRSGMERMSTYYVESLQSVKVNDNYVYVIFVVMDMNNNYVVVPPKKICSQLKDTDIQCVNTMDCNDLKSYNVACPFAYRYESAKKPVKEKQNLKVWIYAVIGVGIFLFILCLLSFFYYRTRKHQHAPELQLRSIPLIPEDTEENVLYGMGDTTTAECAPLYESIDNLKVENDVYGNVDMQEVCVPNNSDSADKNEKLIVQLPKNDEPRYSSPPNLSKV